MKRVIKIPTAPKKFIFGKCMMSSDTYLRENEFIKAIDKLNSLEKKNRMPFLFAESNIPYLNKDLQIELATKGRVIGKVIRYDMEKNYITVEVGDEYPAYKLFKAYESCFETGSAIADVDINANIVPDLVDNKLRRIDINYLQSFTMFMEPKMLILSNVLANSENMETVKIPMLVQPNEEDKYILPDGKWYSKNNLKGAYKRNKGLVVSVSEGYEPVVVNGGPGSIITDLVVGFIKEYNLDENYVMFSINKASALGYALLMNKDLIGESIFMGIVMEASQKSTNVVGLDGKAVKSDELMIYNFIGFTIVINGELKNPEEANEEDGREQN